MKGCQSSRARPRCRAGIGRTQPWQQQKLTMWSRSSSEAFMPSLVKAFNAAHKTQIELQIMPNSEMVQKYAIAAAGGSAPDLALAGSRLYAGLRRLGPARGPDRSGQEPSLLRPPLEGSSWSRQLQGPHLRHCRCRPTPPCCSGTRSCSSRPGSTPRRARPTGPRSRNMPARSTPSAATSAASTSPAPAAAATPSRSCRSSGRRAATSSSTAASAPRSNTPQMRDAIAALSRPRRQGLCALRAPRPMPAPISSAASPTASHRHVADRRLRHRQPRQELSERRVRRDVPARQDRRQGLLRGRRQFRRHARAQEPARR